MTRYITDFYIEVTKPTDDAPFMTIPGDDIQQLSIDESAQEAMDGGDVEIDNTASKYSDDTAVTSGDSLDVYLQLEEDTSPEHWFTAIARDVTRSLEENLNQTLSVEFTDFVFTILSFRVADAAFENEPAQHIITDLVTSQAPEIDTSGVEPLDVDTDIFVQGRRLFDVLVEDIIPISDAVFAHDGRTLNVSPLSDVDSQGVVTPRDFVAPIEIKSVDDELINSVRVDGGVDHAVDAEQTTQSATQRVTNTSRIVTQVPVRKSELARIQVYIQKDTSSSDGVVVRLQADRNGSPVAIDDQQSDIARKKITSDFLSTDGYTTFMLPNHSLAPRENPHLIIEADGTDGHDIGTDGSGNPAYIAEYPYPLIAQATNGESQADYRRRDKRIKDEQLDTLTGVRDKTQSALRHSTEPAKRVEAEADTILTHTLSPGQGVDVGEFPMPSLNGRQFLVTERSTEVTGIRLTTSLTLQEIRTL